MTTAPEAAMDPATAAAHRAMPYTRLTDCGMSPADARTLLEETAGGRPWIEVARDLSTRREKAADDALAAGHRLTALQHTRWAIGAALFAQMGENEDTPLKRDLYLRYDQLVARYAELSGPTMERVEVSHQGGHLVGWLRLPADGTAAATVVIWGGLSGWGAAYLNTADALAARGLACLLAEGPGQGVPRLVDGLHLDEHAVDGFARFLDVVHADTRLGEAVGVHGNSFGGVYAAHLAARDQRVGACVVNGAPATPRLPKFRTARAQFASAIGTDSEDEMTAVLDSLLFDPARHRIACPVLVLHGGQDAMVSDPSVQEPFVRAAGVHGELRTWPDGEHTLYNLAAERDAVVADWFSDR